MPTYFDKSPTRAQTEVPAESKAQPGGLKRLPATHIGLADAKSKAAEREGVYCVLLVEAASHAIQWRHRPRRRLQHRRPRVM